MKLRQRGFTLVEVVIAIGITGAVALVLGGVINTVFMNHRQPSTQEILLQQVQSAGYQASRDIQMSYNMTLSSPNGFPLSLDIPTDQDPLNNYRVDYVLESDTIKRQLYDPLDNLLSETTISEYIDTDNTSIVSLSDGFYRLSVRACKDEETVSTFFDVLRRLSAQ